MEINTSSLDWRIWKLWDRGLDVAGIASRCGVVQSFVPHAVRRVRAWMIAGERSKDELPRLIPSFGNSNKALATLECRDVHPCKACRGEGCEVCNQTGAASLEGDRSPFFCCVCYGSGWDDHKKMIAAPVADSPAVA